MTVKPEYDQICGAKYELTDETLTVYGKSLHRIRALRDIPCYNVKAGDVGGFVESESNLSHEGNCWIDDDACVYAMSDVSDDAYVSGRGDISGMVHVFGSTHVGGAASIYGRIYMPSCISVPDDAEIFSERHILFFGPVGREDWYFLACRTKGGGCSIKRSRTGFMPDDPVEIVNKGHEDWQQSDEYQSLLAMTGNDTGDLKEDEYDFMIQMMLARSAAWSHDVPSTKQEPRRKRIGGKPSVTVPSKYEFTGETIAVDGHILHRIRALRDIPRYGVEKGDPGGFIESEANLSHEGDCWVGDEAYVYEDARISDAAFICSNARASGSAFIYGDAGIYGDAIISGNFSMFMGVLKDDAEVFDDRHIFIAGAVGMMKTPLSSGKRARQCLVGYRLKGGHICIRKNSSSFIHWYEKCQSYHYPEDHGFLYEMARTQPENWPDIEYGFMMEMMKSRIEEWKHDSLY